MFLAWLLRLIEILDFIYLQCYLKKNDIPYVNADPGIEVIRAFGTGGEALEGLEMFIPDALLMGLSSPGMTGLDLIESQSAYTVNRGTGTSWVFIS